MDLGGWWVSESVLKFYFFDLGKMDNCGYIYLYRDGILEEKKSCLIKIKSFIGRIYK